MSEHNWKMKVRKYGRLYRVVRYDANSWLEHKLTKGMSEQEAYKYIEDAANSGELADHA